MSSYMKRTRWSWTLLAGAVALSGCSTMSVYSDQNPQAQISVSQSYTWGAGTLPDDAYPALRSDFVDIHIKASVNRELQQLGLRATPAGETAVDLRIDYHLSAREQWESLTSYHEDGWEEVREFSYTEGMLIVDIFAADTGVLQWRGMATGVVGEDSPTWVAERMDEAIRKMFTELTLAEAQGGTS